MSYSDNLSERALTALDDLVTAFASNDELTYFGCFAPRARCVLPETPGVTITVDAYRDLWRGWRADGWRVASCVSTERDVLCRSRRDRDASGVDGARGR